MRDPVLVMDNKVAMEILTSEGLVDKLTPLPGFNSTHVFFNHQDYRCIGMYHRGHEKDEDNGFMVVMIPMETMSEQEVQAMMQDMIEKTNKPGGRIEKSYIDANIGLS